MPDMKKGVPFDFAEVDKLFDACLRARDWLREEDETSPDAQRAATVHVLGACSDFIHYLGEIQDERGVSNGFHPIMAALHERVETGATPALFAADKALTKEKRPSVHKLRVRNYSILCTSLLSDLGMSESDAQKKALKFVQDAMGRNHSLAPRTTGTIGRWRIEATGGARRRGDDYYKESFEDFLVQMNRTFEQLGFGPGETIPEAAIPALMKSLSGVPDPEKLQT